MKRLLMVLAMVCVMGSVASVFAGLKAAPDFSIPDLSGKTITLSDFKGQVVILDFWDTWCPPCKKGIPDFVSLYNENKDKGLVIIGLALGREGKEKVVQFAKDKEITYPLVIATDKAIDDFGPIEGIPTTIVIDKNGNIVERYTGFTEKSEFESVIAPLLK